MRSIIYTMLLGLSITMTAQTMGKQSAAQLQESPAGSRILWLMDEIKAGEPVSEEAIRSNFAPKLIDKMGLEELQNMIAELQEYEGSLEIYRAKRTKMTEYKITAKGTKSDEWFAMIFYFEDVSPHRMLGFTLDSTDAVIEGDPIYPQ